MTDETKIHDEPDRDDETMARLLRLAGPREPVPRDIEQRVYDRVHREWLTNTRAPESERVYAKVHRDWARRRIVRRWTIPVAMAASVVLAVALLLRPAPEPALIAVGTVAKIVGEAPVGGIAGVGRKIHNAAIRCSSPPYRNSPEDANRQMLPPHTMCVPSPLSDAVIAY